MTIRFRIDALDLATTKGMCEYRFTSDLTVLARARLVSGKTTLLELIKFAFGGDAILAPVAVENVESVTLRVQIGDERLELTRSLDSAKRVTVRVTDLITRERLPDHRLDGKQPSLNTLLLRCLGLRDDLRAAAGGTSTRAGYRITFADILTYLYIPQSQINRDIAHSQDSYREPKRKTVFELLFGLVDTDILELRSQISSLRGEITEAETRHATVVQFLHDSGTASRQEALEAQQRAQQALAAAERELADLREAVDPVMDRQTQTLRDLLTQAEHGLAASRAAVQDLTRRQARVVAEHHVSKPTWLAWTECVRQANAWPASSSLSAHVVCSPLGSAPSPREPVGYACSPTLSPPQRTTTPTRPANSPTNWRRWISKATCSPPSTWS